MMNNKRSLRFFNTTGPCDPYYHYMLPPKDRLVGAQLHRYIDHFQSDIFRNSYAPSKFGISRYITLGFKISDFRFQISDFRFQISDFRFQISDSKFKI